MESVSVRVPATTANLAAGFDTLGCALGLYNTLTFTRQAEGLSFSGCERSYCNEQNLAYRAYARVLRELKLPPEGLHIDIDAAIPVSRGLGSSAALLVAGAVAANAFHGNPLDRAALLALCTELEGHPDNVAPALYGGFLASCMDGDTALTARYDIHPALRFVALIPDFPLSTQAARSVLPAFVPHEDAVFNATRAALLPRALADGEERLLALALQDRLHQPYRRRLIPEYDEVEAMAAEHGCRAFCISGAGPALLALTRDEGFAGRMEAAVGSLQHRWQVLELPVDFDGAKLV